MGIDIKALGPDAQKQIAEQLAARKKGVKKYRNTPTERMSADGVQIHFDSQKEARRFDELMLCRDAGAISELKLQPEFTLQEAYTTPDGQRIRAIKYRADFSYMAAGKLHVEDVKSPATRTRVYAIKKKLMREKFGIDVMEV